MSTQEYARWRKTELNSREPDAARWRGVFNGQFPSSLGIFYLAPSFSDVRQYGLKQLLDQCIPRAGPV